LPTIIYTDQCFNLAAISDGQTAARRLVLLNHIPNPIILFVLIFLIILIILINIDVVKRIMVQMKIIAIGDGIL
jgi:hypothetical protein